MEFARPTSWRKGQTIFNFLEWLRVVKDMPANQSVRLADPFHLSDEQFNQLWDEYNIALNEVMDRVEVTDVIE